jgi:hypothetical protein
MENREAIEALRDLLDTTREYPHLDGMTMFGEAITLAISALKKQEKKPAKAKFNKRYNKFVYFCPVCGEVTGKYDFCSECGQAIDYDNTEPYTEGES